MWKSRLFWKLFLLYGVLYVGLAVAYWVLASWWQRDVTYRHVHRQLAETAELLRRALPVGEHGTLQLERLDQWSSRLAGDSELEVRVTILTADGTALADSHEDTTLMENHFESPEIVAAREFGHGEAIRWSRTVERRLYFFALRLGTEGTATGYVRVAADVEGIDRQLQSNRRMLATLALGSALATAPLVWIVARRIVRPLIQLTGVATSIAAGDYTRPVETNRRDEIGKLALAMENMQRELAHRLGRLQANGQQMSTVLDSMVEGVLAVSADGCVLLANPASRRMLEVHSNQVVGRPLLEVVRNLDMHALVREALERETSPQREIAVGRPDRRTFLVFANRLPGEPCPGVVLALHDVTELRRLESIRREFVANVSHELKTPLASIKAFAETLRLGAVDDPPNNLRFVERIEEQAERLHQLIVDLLSLSKVESGNEVFHFSTFSLDKVIRDCIDVAQELTATTDVVVLSQAPNEEVHVWADRDAVRTILENLIDNAIKYSPPRGCVIVRWHVETDAALLEVEDDGIGISPADQERIFERFYRVDKARSRELGGTGLGLSIVKHLSQALGGSVRVTSEPGRGSTFSVRLQRARRLDRPAPMVSTAAARRQAAT